MKANVRASSLLCESCGFPLMQTAEDYKAGYVRCKGLINLGQDCSLSDVPFRLPTVELEPVGEPVQALASLEDQT